MKNLLLGLCALPLVSGFASAQALNLTVNLPENETNLGNLMVGIFASQDAFDNREITLGLVQVAVPGENVIEVSGLAAGTYGISIFLDRNENEDLDTNLLGIPSEPYGFTLNPVIRFSAPKFEEFAFEYGGQGGALTVDLNGI